MHILEYFTTHEWEFSIDNVHNLLDHIKHPKDREDFDFDIRYDLSLQNNRGLHFATALNTSLTIFMCPLFWWSSLDTVSFTIVLTVDTLLSKCATMMRFFNGSQLKFALADRWIGYRSSSNTYWAYANMSLRRILRPFRRLGPNSTGKIFLEPLNLFLRAIATN